MTHFTIDTSNDPNFLKLGNTGSVTAENGSVDWRDVNDTHLDPVVREYLEQTSRLDWVYGEAASMEELPPDSNFTVDEFLNGIQDGEKAISTLEVIQEKLQSSKSDDTDVAKLAQIAVENISRRLGIPYTAPGLENFKQKTVALEGIGSFIKTIIDAIINTLKSIWNWLSGSQSKKSVEDADKQGEVRKQQIEKRKKEEKEGKTKAVSQQSGSITIGDSGTKKEPLSLPHMMNFGYREKEITLTMVQKSILGTMKSYELCSAIVEEYSDLLKEIEAVLARCKSSGKLEGKEFRVFENYATKIKRCFHEHFNQSEYDQAVGDLVDRLSTDGKHTSVNKGAIRNFENGSALVLVSIVYDNIKSSSKNSSVEVGRIKEVAWNERDGETCLTFPTFNEYEDCNKLVSDGLKKSYKDFENSISKVGIDHINSSLASLEKTYSSNTNEAKNLRFFGSLLAASYADISGVKNACKNYYLRCNRLFNVLSKHQKDMTYII